MRKSAGELSLQIYKDVELPVRLTDGLLRLSGLQNDRDGTGRRIEIIVRLRYTYFDFVCIIQSVSFSRNGCAVRVETAGYNRREGV